MNDEYHDKVKETKILNSLIVEEDRNIEIMKEDIRKINKKISDVEVRINIFKIYSNL